jgi:DNA-binding NtrC family response regulator
MLLSLSSPPVEDPLIENLRSLASRGRHHEADRLAHSGRRTVATERRGVFLTLRAEIALGLGRFADALSWTAEARRGLDSSGIVAECLRVTRIRALIGLGRFRDASDFVEAFDESNARFEGDLLLFRTHILLHSGRLGDAKGMAYRACENAVASKSRARVLEALLLQARVARESGDLTFARLLLDRATRVSNGLRDPNGLATALSERADLMAHSGAWKAASADAAQSSRLFSRTLSPNEHVSAGRRAGLIGLAQGSPNDALVPIERAADVSRRGFGTQEARAEIDLLLADAQLAGRDPVGALERATAALAVFRDAQDPGGLARARVRCAIAALANGDIGLALREARMAGAVKDAGPVATGLADLALGRVLLAKGSPEAAPAFERAASVASLYPPLRAVAHLGAALAAGASHTSDRARILIAEIESFGDQRIVAIVRNAMKDAFGVDLVSAGPITARAACGQDEEGQSELREFLPRLLGGSRSVTELGERVRRVAPSDLSVSIYGETGSGKENVARAIHEFSRRRGEFVPVNAPSLTDELFESTMFGHRRGAFTGAHADQVGQVELAHGGTLFIDEIADLSSRSQVRLLRFLEQGTYRRLGDTREKSANVRIVVAANRRLQTLVEAGEFRTDLLFRLLGAEIEVPALRDRDSDVLRLARHFVKDFSSGAARLSAASESEIRAHAWPGNVRELRQEMKRAVVLSESDRIEWRRPAQRNSSATAGAAHPPSSTTLQAALGEHERAIVKSALAQCCEKAQAARLLGISRQALHQKIVRFGL